ncbi:MAG TPA: PIG-L family deacetylase [Candidatus Brocadiia bacterium]|nr:PIG-L family deacetylase [Candidatus Brocadiia bacterium]
MGKKTKTVLSIMAHPDDAEFTCAGTMARLHKEHGWQVAVATMTPGDCGSATDRPQEISRIRTAEARKAVEILDGRYFCAGSQDLFIFYDRLHMMRVTEIIREVKPDIVITHSPQDYMLDHEVTSTLVRAATFGAPIPNFPTEAPSPAPPLAHIPHLYYADPMEGHDIFGNEIKPDLIVDISGEIDAKERMLCCHASQREWLRAHHGMDEYVRMMKAWSQKRGGEAGFAFGEGFRKHKGHAYPTDDILRNLLC